MAAALGRPSPVGRWYALPPPLAELIQHDGGHDDKPLHGLRPIGRDADEYQSIAQDAQKGCTQEHSQDCTLTAHEADTACIRANPQRCYSKGICSAESTG
jgi:hypothetical protein